MDLTSIVNYINLFIVNANFPSLGSILVQLFVGLLGSLIASLIVAALSGRKFQRAIADSEGNVLNALNPINTMVTAQAHNIQTLAQIVPAVNTIGNEVKTLAQLVDKIRQGLEKSK